MYSEKGLLIDGGYTNNLPVDALRNRWYVKVLMAVDVENKDGDIFSLDRVTNYGEYLSGWWLIAMRLWHTLNPFAKKTYVPRFSEIITSLTFINHNRNIRNFIDSQLMDIYVRPELGNTKLLDYHKMEQIWKLGYRYAKNRIVEWKLKNAAGTNKRGLYARRQRQRKNNSVRRSSSSSFNMTLSLDNKLNQLNKSFSTLEGDLSAELSDTATGTTPKSARSSKVRQRRVRKGGSGRHTPSI